MWTPYNAFIGDIFSTSHTLATIPYNMKVTPKNNPYEKEVLIIKSHVKNYLKSRGMWVKPETYRTINDALIDLLDKSIIRTKLSKMRTISPKHI